MSQLSNQVGLRLSVVYLVKNNQKLLGFLSGHIAPTFAQRLTPAVGSVALLHYVIGDNRQASRDITTAELIVLQDQLLDSPDLICAGAYFYFD